MTKFLRVSCRAHFNPALTGKENKDALKVEVQQALAELGLAIDEGDVKFHHFKLVHKKNKKPKFVVMGLDVGEGPSMEKMKASKAFAEEVNGGREASYFTVRWGEKDVAAEVDLDRKSAEKRSAEKKTIDKKSNVVSGKEAKEANKAVAKQASKKDKVKAKAMIDHADSTTSLFNHKQHSPSMTSTLLAGVICAVGLGGAMLIGFHHRGLLTAGLNGLGGLRGR
jgi:hypothetical protein